MSFAAQTPRPGPGAFYPTPAPARTQPAAAAPDPVRRKLFSDRDAVAGSGAAATITTTTTTTVITTAANGGSGAVSGAVSGNGGLASGDIVPQPRNTSMVNGNEQPSREEPTPVGRAARAINQFLQADGNYPEIDSYCRQGSSSDYDLPALDSAWTPFHRTHMYPIPNQIFDHYNAGRVQTLMGLFADINHAWVAIDNSLFLWDYTDAEPELIGFEEQRHTIQAVALVPPKPGVFVDTITHVLVVATTNDMMVLGVQAEANPAGSVSVSLYQTNMHMALRGQDVRIITGSAGGRVFFGGSGEIDLAELYYEKEERWFWGKCGKINHTNPRWLSMIPPMPSLLPFGSSEVESLVDIVVDDTRSLVYTLSSRSTIRTYHMDGAATLVKVIEKEKTSCLRDMTHMVNASPLLTDRVDIVAISPITATESSRLHLMALTNTGCRLFLSATSSASFMVSTSSTPAAPQSMQVQYIKFPPPTSRPNQQPQQQQQQQQQQQLQQQQLRLGGEHHHPHHQYVNENFVDLASRALVTSRQGQRFAPGYFVDFVSKDSLPTEDLVFVSAPETGRIKNTPPTTALRYHEHATWIEIGSRAEAVGLISKPFGAAAQPIGFGNELAVQYDEAPCEFAVLTNTGVHVIRRRRLVDMFAAAMRGSVGDEGLEAEARRFTHQYGRVETVSTALAVACGHGGDGRPGVARAIDQATQDRARTVFVDFGGNPTFAETDGGVVTTDMVRLSSRHDALGLYLARLVRLLWKGAVVTPVRDAGGGLRIVSTVPAAKLVSVQEGLERLRRFLDANRPFILGLAGPSDLRGLGSRRDEVALQAEHQALHALERLMESISEGISFVQMLFDERVTDIYNRLDEATRRRVCELTYERLFSQASGRDLAKLLVRAIVNRNIESGSNVETVADALRRRCGSFCSPDDVVVFKAQEQLQRASEQELNTNLRRTLLLESLRLFERVAGSLTYDNLEAAVAQYAALRYFAGAIRLCLTTAREKDRGSAALAWAREGRPTGDPRTAAFAERKGCYDLVHAVLQELDDVSSAEPETAEGGGRMTLMATKRAEAYDVVNGSDDEVFHFDLYEWYISQGWADRLLTMGSPHVVTFLQELAATSVERAELLCRFYTLRDRFYDAGRVQFELAASDFAIGIKDRISLLSQARGNAMVATAGVSRQQQQLLSHEATELLEVAHIQDDVLERLRVDPRFADHAERVQELEQELDGKVLDLTDLFNQYADQAGYHDLCLLIYHAADYHTSATIAMTWRNLVQQIHDQADGDGDEAAAPYESVAARVQTIAHRTSLDSFVFPVGTLLPLLCQYSVENQQDGRVGADPCWPVRLFLSLGVPHDTVARILEEVFDTQDRTFTGSARVRVVEWITAVVESWAAELRRRGGGGGGVGGVGRFNGAASFAPGNTMGGNGSSGVVASWVVELIQRCESALPTAGHGNNPGGMDVAELRRRVKTVRRDVQMMMDRGGMGATLRFA